ncbi:MAG: class II fumarate hydratase [Clostridia bacterium]|nr:class II fumarate hydratase [Clostridia bacterium]
MTDQTNVSYRIEHDTMGEVRVPSNRFWGAQTQRSLENFPIGIETMPREIIRAFGILKKAAALANLRLGALDQDRATRIAAICDRILAGELDGEFPLSVWQTGSGTQSNMNANEVIAGMANRQGGAVIHPNDHVNRSQSSNDTFPTAMHIAAVTGLETRLLPALERMIGTLRDKEREHEGILKSGRTHLMDATPIAFSQEISAWRSMLEHDRDMICATLPPLRELALGGTAVGTGINAPKEFGALAAEEISALTGTKFVSADNKFHSLTSKDALVFSHGAFKALAADLMKIANDVRWLASGPRCGLGEIAIPENEPGSSIMPGKVNPTQCEAVTMIAVQVMGNDVSVGMAASQGNFQLNVFMPVLIYNYLQSLTLLADGMESFRLRCLSGMTAKREAMQSNLDRSLMLATALNPHVGYENAARVVKTAYAENITLKQAAAKLGIMDEETFDRCIDPKNMI